MSGGFEQGKESRAWLKGLLALQEIDQDRRPPEEPKPQPPSGKFPMAGLDLINHKVRVALSFSNPPPGGAKEEIITLEGTMVIQRSDPYTDKQTGLRQIDFKVRSWVASSWSHSLQGVVTYVLSHGLDQPLSTIVSNQAGIDFPANFNFNVVFDVRLNNSLVYQEVHGRPIGEAFMVVPPSGDRRMAPTIRTFKDAKKVQMVHPQLGDIVATPVDCNDQDTSRTLVEFPGMPLG
jgi:hypothetical protein